MARIPAKRAGDPRRKFGHGPGTARKPKSRAARAKKAVSTRWQSTKKAVKARRAPKGRTTPKKAGAKPVSRGPKAQKAMARKRPPKPMSKAGGKRSGGRTFAKKPTRTVSARTRAAKNPKSRYHPSKNMSKRGGKVSGGRAAPRVSKASQNRARRGRPPAQAGRGRSGLYAKKPTHTARGRQTGRHATKDRNRRKITNKGFGNTRAMKRIKARNGGHRTYAPTPTSPRIRRYGLTHSTIPKSAWKQGGIISAGGRPVKLNTIW